jgi:hypothetical protein
MVIVIKHHAVPAPGIIHRYIDLITILNVYFKNKRNGFGDGTSWSINENRRFSRLGITKKYIFRHIMPSSEVTIDSHCNS